MSTPSSSLSPYSSSSSVNKYDPDTITNINLISSFISSNQGEPPLPLPLDEPGQEVVYILAGSAILHTTRILFNHLSNVTSPCTLVIAGGKGHSTDLLYRAVSRDPTFSCTTTSEADNGLQLRLDDLPEARVLELLLYRFFPALVRRVEEGKLKVLIDDKSRNCGENALFAKRLLDENGIRPDKVVVVQDPTMSRRTCTSLAKVYEDEGGVVSELATLAQHQSQPQSRVRPSPAPMIHAWPTFVPLLEYSQGNFAWSSATLSELGVEPGNSGLWDEQRFIDLVLGEIPRMRDDEEGYRYGPRGKGFIVHVDIPEGVLEADRVLRMGLRTSR